MLDVAETPLALPQRCNQSSGGTACKVHTNGLENFWSLLKRCLKGTYVNVEPFHLFRYCDEQTFRFNERKSTDSERFLSAVPSIVGRRLTYKGLTGNVEVAATS
jgi:hypothetical protein